MFTISLLSTDPLGIVGEHQNRLLDKSGAQLAVLQPDEAMLSDFPVFERACIHVMDQDPAQAVAEYVCTFRAVLCFSEWAPGRLT